jgi:hypothetical protein
MNIKVHNLNSPRTGNPVANQYEIKTKDNYIFQSYNSIIAKRNRETHKITLDSYYWDYSVTTLKYLKQFLNTNMSKKEIQKAIETGQIKTANLNK